MTPSSFIAFELFRMQPGLLLRYTEFVEEQQPVLSREVLRLVKGTLGVNISGWGLSTLWTEMMGYPKDKIAVIDATPTGHHRRHQTGPMYTKVLRNLDINAMSEFEAITSIHGWPHHTTILSSVALDPAHPLTPARLARQKKH